VRACESRECHALGGGSQDQSRWDLEGQQIGLSSASVAPSALPPAPLAAPLRERRAGEETKGER
jgi:hypothetical protein